MHFFSQEALFLAFALLLGQAIAHPLPPISISAVTKIAHAVKKVATPENMDQLRAISATAAEVSGNGAMAYNALRGDSYNTGSPRGSYNTDPSQF